MRRPSGPSYPGGQFLGEAVLLAACVIGTVVGLYPAVRASRVPPTEALRSV